jgi:hypothetical protein
MPKHKLLAYFRRADNGATTDPWRRYTVGVDLPVYYITLHSILSTFDLSVARSSGAHNSKVQAISIDLVRFGYFQVVGIPERPEAGLVICSCILTSHDVLSPSGLIDIAHFLHWMFTIWFFCRRRRRNPKHIIGSR